MFSLICVSTNNWFRRVFYGSTPALCMLFGLRNHARSGRYPYAAMPGIVVSGSLSPEPSDRANRSVRCENMDTLAAPPVRALAGRLLATIA